MERLHTCNYLIYKPLSMLTVQTSLPPNQPTGPKVKNMPNFDVFQSILLKFGKESLDRGTQHIHIINSVLPPNQPTTHCTQPAYQPTSPKVKNGYNFAIFQPICLKLGIETQNENTQYMYWIYIHFLGFVIFWF